MAGEVPCDDAKIVLQPEPHREPGGIGGEAEYIESHAFCEFRRRLRDWAAGAYFLQNRADLACLHIFVDAEQDTEDHLRCLCHPGLGGIGPEHRGGIADLDAMAAVAL